MQQITRQQLRTELADGRDLKLVMSPGSADFLHHHIPGTLHFDDPAAAFDALAVDDDIVVYDTGPWNPTSIQLCEQLTTRGYRHVRRYAGGIADWIAGGLPVEGRVGS